MHIASTLTIAAVLTGAHAGVSRMPGSTNSMQWGHKRAEKFAPDYWLQASLEQPPNATIGVNRQQVGVCQANGEGTAACIAWDTLRHAAGGLASEIFGYSNNDDCGSHTGTVGDGGRVKYRYTADNGGECHTTAELATIEGAIKNHLKFQQNQELCGDVCLKLDHGSDG